jgi:menaquinone-dependent protoporphyrinogen oxidase
MTDLEVRRVEQGFPAALRGREHRLFAGVVRMGGLALWGRVFWRLIGGRDGDHRNWPAIATWAGGIAAELSRVRTSRAQ